MLTENTLNPIIKIVDPVSKAAIIEIVTIVTKDGVEIARNVNSMTFQHDQLDDVKTFLGVETGPEINYLTAIWVE